MQIDQPDEETVKLRLRWWLNVGYDIPVDQKPGMTSKMANEIAKASHKSMDPPWSARHLGTEEQLVREVLQKQIEWTNKSSSSRG